MKTSITPIRLLLSNAYLVENETGLILVDAGMPGEAKRILRHIRQISSSDLDLIFITHAHIDHYGSAADLRKATGARIAVHEADSEAMAGGVTRLGTAKGRGRVVKSLLPLIQRLWPTPPTQADIVIEDTDDLREVGIGARVLHTPGHTVGSSCLLTGEAAFVGDLVSTTGSRVRLQRFYAESWSHLEASLRVLIDANPQTLYPGHGPRAFSGDELHCLAKDYPGR